MFHTLKYSVVLVISLAVPQQAFSVSGYGPFENDAAAELMIDLMEPAKLFEYGDHTGPDGKPFVASEHSFYTKKDMVYKDDFLGILSILAFADKKVRVRHTKEKRDTFSYSKSNCEMAHAVSYMLLQLDPKKRWVDNEHDDINKYAVGLFAYAEELYGRQFYRGGVLEGIRLAKRGLKKCVTNMRSSGAFTYLGPDHWEKNKEVYNDMVKNLRRLERALGWE
ncbi:MAG: hypothetical protein LC541_20615 [Candidatus Thiodiazotropha sp.]|nr:hypothetical protein [Candidatus Thiodiazotropha sp.]MCM8885667.1 hypothetical protein [Candidatus Thiodiazotropha sp.]